MTGRNILGFNVGEKRVYHIDKNYLSQEEYEQGRVICNILWGENGLVDSLGATWNMVHDPRFYAIEDAFIYERKALLGGDATANRQYISADSALQDSSLQNLEQYATILGEGRHFRKIVIGQGLNPQTFHTEPEETLWRFIRQECPNYFSKSGIANREANILYRLFRCELLALVDDYATIPYCQEWVNLETSEIVRPLDGIYQEQPEQQVFAEVDFLERALTLRASLRATAIKVIQTHPAIMTQIEEANLTDYESDLVLKKIYSYEFGALYKLPGEILAMVQQFSARPMEDRKKEETEFLIQQSKKFIHSLETGELEHLKADMTIEETEETPDQKLLKDIMEDPITREAFFLLVSAEENNDLVTADRLHKALFENSEPLTLESIIQIKKETLGSRTASKIKNITPQ